MDLMRVHARRFLALAWRPAPVSFRYNLTPIYKLLARHFQCLTSVTYRSSPHVLCHQNGASMDMVIGFRPSYLHFRSDQSTPVDSNLDFAFFHSTQT